MSFVVKDDIPEGDGVPSQREGGPQHAVLGCAVLQESNASSVEVGVKSDHGNGVAFKRDGGTRPVPPVTLDDDLGPRSQGVLENALDSPEGAGFDPGLRGGVVVDDPGVVSGDVLLRLLCPEHQGIQSSSLVLLHACIQRCRLSNNHLETS